VKRIKSQQNDKLKPTVDIDELFNGDRYELTQGDDFECSPSTAAQAVRDEFRRLYGQLIVKSNGSKVTVEVKTGKAQRP
jgi:hypothetical protein